MASPPAPVARRRSHLDVPSESHQSDERDIRQHLEAQRYREAFELLVARLRHKVFRLALSLVRDESLAEDMTQDIFVRIWKGLPGYQAQASLSTWVYAISRNTCFTELKRRAHRPTLSLQDPAWAEVLHQAPELATRETERGAGLDVASLLARLPEHYRRVITLFYLEQKSYDDVAAMLDLPLGTVKTYLHRARQCLVKLAGRRPGVEAAPGGATRT